MEIELAVHDIDRFADLHIGDVAHVDHRRVHAHAAENRANLPTNHHESLVVFPAQVAVAVTDGDCRDSGRLLGHPVAAVADRFPRLHDVDVPDGTLDFHDRTDGVRGGNRTHAIVAVKREAGADHVEMAFGVRERACRAATVANWRADTFGFQNIDQAAETLYLNVRLGVARHVGRGEVREHPLEFDMLEVKRRADAVEIFGIKAVAVHARVYCKVGTACRPRFLQELVKELRRAEVRNRGGQLKFYKIGEVGGSAGAKHQDREVHAVLAQEHAFVDVGYAEVVGTTELGGKRAGQAPVPVGVCLHGNQDFRIGGDLAPDKLDIVAQGVQVDFYPVRARNLV